MYAVVIVAGKQFKVKPDQLIRVPLLSAEVGETVVFEEVLSRGEGSDFEAGQPYLEGVSVSAEVMAHGKGSKLRVFKMKRRKNYRRTIGHRTLYTELKIKEIS
ncbi:MAG: 50S ribosomal protein L21 [Candidatus Krumholzibacteria bacterium]|nr:50S ribosomal protein L21 [Candidatus Krumholzibacteria bacterium]MDP6669451.1 50S ribosomal protein L21 [Candidatus Krumholzibacteria bacterium]MDP6797287.1 50S ribosomal protein L21 [Candidatus Krumholzibacteria bacterium]MDP7021226.1 50S ribosomal protein L21 [Candidatus Krumholzibacteria bacterium]